MARVTKINVGGTNYDIAHEGELKNSGFEVVTELPTTGLFEGRQVVYQNRVWVYSNGWVSPNNPVSFPTGVTLQSSTEELTAASRYIELRNFQLEQIPELLNKALFISNNDNCVKKSDRLYELIDNETGTITVKSGIVNPVLGQTLRYSAINPSYDISELHMRIFANNGEPNHVYCVYIPQNVRYDKAIYKIEYYVYTNATGDGDINNRDNYVWKSVFEKELQQFTEILYPLGRTVFVPYSRINLYIYNIRVSITPTTKNGNNNIDIKDIDIKYYGINHKPPFFANMLINYDTVINPTQTGETFKSIPWILQYLVQGVNWLKANNVRLSAYNSKVAALEQADSDNNTSVQSVSTDLTELSNGLAAVARSGSYNDLTDTPTLADVATSGDYNDLLNRPTFSGSYNDLTDKPTLFSGSYEDLTNKPTLATVATSGDYNDLLNRPTFSGSYNDLTDKPTLFSGSYNDLTDKPTIPSTFADLGGNVAAAQISEGSIANSKLANSSMTLNGITVSLGGQFGLPWQISWNSTLYKARIMGNWLQIYHNNQWVDTFYLLRQEPIQPTNVSQITSLDDLSWYDERVSEYEIDSNTTFKLLKGDVSIAAQLLQSQFTANQLTLNLYPIPAGSYNKGALDKVISDLKDNNFAVFVENDLDTILTSGSDFCVRIKISKVPTYKAIIECYVAR